MPTINCAICGAPQETKRTNTKFCKFHRAYKDLMFARERAQVKTCPVLEKKFLPIKTIQKTSMEAQADVGVLTQHEIVECANCGQNATQFAHDVKVCCRCVDDPANAEWIYGVMHKKDRKLKEHYKGANI